MPRFNTPKKFSTLFVVKPAAFTYSRAVVHRLMIAVGFVGVRPRPVEPAARVDCEGTDRKRLLIRKADATRNRLIFIAHAVRKLFNGEKLVALLKGERLDTLPKKLASPMERGDIA